MNKGKLSVERLLREALQIKNSIFFFAGGKSRCLWFLKVFFLAEASATKVRLFHFFEGDQLIPS